MVRLEVQQLRLRAQESAREAAVHGALELVHALLRRERARVVDAVPEVVLRRRAEAQAVDRRPEPDLCADRVFGANAPDLVGGAGLVVREHRPAASAEVRVEAPRLLI